MKKKKILFGIVVIGVSTLTGCTASWRRSQDELNAQNNAQIAVMEAEYNATVIRLEAEAQLYYVQLEAERILLSAEAEAQAEVIRAKGIAESMHIIQEYINEDYLIHFYIRTLGTHEGVIYVATELGLPLFPQLNNNGVHNEPKTD